MAVRSRRFFGPTTAAAGTTVLLYTVPANRTARFSLITVVSQGTGTAASYFRINSTTANPVAIVFHSGTDNDHTFLVGMVLNPGDELHVSAGTGVNLRVAGFGSLLDGPPV